MDTREEREFFELLDKLECSHIRTLSTFMFENLDVRDQIYFVDKAKKMLKEDIFE